MMSLIQINCERENDDELFIEKNSQGALGIHASFCEIFFFLFFISLHWK